MSQVEPEKEGVMAAAEALLQEHCSVMLATTGGAISPWVAGAYFTTEGSSLLLFLEAHGTSLANVRANPRVAFSVSDNDAKKDFLQGMGNAEILAASEEPRVRALLLAKMPWYQTFTPVVPVRIDPVELRLSSLSRGWFPARRVTMQPASGAAFA